MTNPRPVPSPAALRTWRETHGLTQEQAALIAGVGRVTWTRWEIGTRDIPQWLTDVLRQRHGSAPSENA